MAINILYQPEAASVGMASYRAGQGEFAKEKAKFEQAEREMQQRERMQAKQQAMQERQAALGREADAAQQQQQLGFQAQAQGFAQAGREKLFDMEQKAQQDMFGQRQQAEMEQLDARAKADQAALEWKSKVELEQETANIAAQEKAIRDNPYLDEKQKGALIGTLGIKQKDIRDAMLTKPDDPKPIAHLPETDQPGMPVMDPTGRTVGFRDRYGVPQPFTPPKSPKDPPSRDEFAKRYSEATKALTDGDGNAPDPERVMKHLREQDALYNQMYGGEQPPAGQGPPMSQGPGDMQPEVQSPDGIPTGEPLQVAPPMPGQLPPGGGRIPPDGGLRPPTAGSPAFDMPPIPPEMMPPQQQAAPPVQQAPALSPAGPPPAMPPQADGKPSFRDAFDAAKASKDPAELTRNMDVLRESLAGIPGMQSAVEDMQAVNNAKIVGRTPTFSQMVKAKQAEAKIAMFRQVADAAPNFHSKSPTARQWTAEVVDINQEIEALRDKALKSGNATGEDANKLGTLMDRRDELSGRIRIAEMASNPKMFEKLKKNGMSPAAFSKLPIEQRRKILKEIL